MCSFSIFDPQNLRASIVYDANIFSIRERKRERKFTNAESVGIDVILAWLISYRTLTRSVVKLQREMYM